MLDYFFQDEARKGLIDSFKRTISSNFLQIENPLIGLPTGTGKSHVIAKTINAALKIWPKLNIFVLVHDKRLVMQDYEKLTELNPLISCGLHCEGLGRRDLFNQVIFGSMKSVLNTYLKGGKLILPDLVLIDEAHLLSEEDETTYQQIFNFIKAVKPRLIVGGLSATLYRSKIGTLLENGIFNKIVSDYTSSENFIKLVRMGYMSPIKSKPTKISIDRNLLTLRGGEFSEKSSSNEVLKILHTALVESFAVYKEENRTAWLGFLPSIDRCEDAADILREFGVDAEVVHSKIKEKVADKRIADFKNGNLECLLNKNILTTGFDYPELDFCTDFDPTNSANKHVQKVGRLTRIAPRKNYSILLDYAGNIENIGPINDPIIPQKRSKTREPGDAPVRICERCGLYNRPGAKYCGDGSTPEESKSLGGCGIEFIFRVKISETASTKEVMQYREKIEYWEVEKVHYDRYQKSPESTECLRAVYYCANGKRVYQFISFSNRARGFVTSWWQQRSETPLPCSVSVALERIRGLRSPKSVKVDSRTKTPQLLDCIW